MQSSPPPRGRSWASGDDAAFIATLVIVGCLAVMGYMAWTRSHADISRGFARLAHWHIQVIQLFSSEYASLDQQLLTADYGRVTPKGIYDVANSVGRWFRLPVALLLGTLALICLFRSPGSRFRQRLDLDGLITVQAKSFRFIAAYAARRLRLRALRDGDPRPADPALHGPEWLDRYAVRDGKLNKWALRTAIVRQLGAAWRGPHKADTHARVLFAAFALHAEQRQQEALKLLGDLSETLRPFGREAETGPDTALIVSGAIVSYADDIIASEASGPATACAAQHGYTMPALMSVLVEARRRGGVLPPAAFGAIKLVDRPLWYALHSLGFPSEAHGRTQHPNPAVEAIGARDHWAVECSVSRPLHTPAIERACAALTAMHARLQASRPPAAASGDRAGHCTSQPAKPLPGKDGPSVSNNPSPA